MPKISRRKPDKAKDQRGGARKAAAPAKTKKPATKPKPAAKKPAPKKAAAKAKPAAKTPAPKKAAAPKKKVGAARRAPAKRDSGPAEIVEQVLSSLGLGLTRLEQGDVVQWDLEVPAEEHFELVAQLIDDHQIVVYLVFREKAVAERMGAMIEVISRVNHGLLVGAYEVDADHGFVRLKNFLDFKGTALAHQLVVNLVTGLRDVSEVYDDAILAVLRGHLTPREAIEQVEA